MQILGIFTDHFPSFTDISPIITSHPLPILH